MTPENADTLARRIINTFRHTPALTEWRDVLGKLDHHRAIDTFELCRDTIVDNLPIARYLTEYRQRALTEPAPRLDHGNVVPLHTGRQAAWQGYSEECRVHLRKPNSAWFNSIFASIQRHPTARTQR